MAAFNFTLDESQTLKSAYETNISRLREEGGRDLQDLVAGLGELHEFDQEYETARLYYRRSISLLDSELEQVIGSSILDPRTSRIEIIGGIPKGQEKARLYMTWGVARLRLMLQIGMTFEHSRNLERAAMEYQNARTMSRSLLVAMLDEHGRLLAGEQIRKQAEGVTGDNRLHALKHLNLLFQPIFAEAWVAEKLAGGVDTSTSLAEQELWYLRGVLPFVREAKLELSHSPIEVQGSNFALIATELHNKTGDLYFFKGRQLARAPLPVEGSNPDEDAQGTEGYLLRAHYHYCVGLHELRRFVTHRRLSSGSKLSLGDTYNTIVPGCWPDFVFRAAGGGFNDLAEALLGRVSLLDLLKEWPAEESTGELPNVADDVERLLRVCSGWFEGAMVPDERSNGRELVIGAYGDLGTLDDWLGRWNVNRYPSDPKLIEYDRIPGDRPTKILAASLGFSLVSSRYLEQGGYLEDAGRELVKVCETISHYLWWALSVRRLMDWGLGREVLSCLSCWDYLFEVGLYSLERADRLFRQSRRADGMENGKYLLGGKIPVALMTQACSLGLVAHYWKPIKEEPEGKSWKQWDRIKTGVEKLLEEWTGEACDGGDLAGNLRERLHSSLIRHSYPMINRLHTLKIVIDAESLAVEEPAQKTLAWTRELLELEASLNAPLHFTTFHSGATCALVLLRHITIGKSLDHLRVFGYASERALLASQEMYTMRRAFYENISKLYYLYDDFNDRQLHFNHAIQMAGADLASLLRDLLSDYFQRETRPAG